MAIHYESAGETQKSSRFTGTGCSLSKTLPKARLELARPCEHYDLNVACIPFHHFGATITAFFVTEGSVPFRNVFVKQLVLPAAKPPGSTKPEPTPAEAHGASASIAGAPI